MICVDSSVVVKWLVTEELSTEAYALYEWAAYASQQIVAPQWLMMEVGNVLLKKTRRPPTITPNEALRAFSDALEMDIFLHDPEFFHRNAFRIAVSYRLPAIYDAYYLALAADAKCPFWTADERLLRTLDGRLPYVHWIGDFRA